MESVFHDRERRLIASDILMRPLYILISRVGRPFQKLVDGMIDFGGPFFINFLVFIGLGSFTSQPDAHDSETTKALWDEAKRRGIYMRQFRPFGLPRNIFVAKYRGQSCVFEKVPLPSRVSRSLLWMDDKSVVKEKFKKVGFPVADGGLCKTEFQAIRMFENLKKPLVVKPHSGSGTRHTSVHINSEEKIIKAFRSAVMISPWAVIEEELVGPVFRATMIDKKIAAVLRRDPAQVKGDGKKTITQLIDDENKNPLRRGPVFAPIIVPKDMDISRVPSNGETVLLHWKVNWGVGGISRDATDEVHPINRKLFEDIAKYLDDVFIGIDFIIGDISKPWTEQERCGVIECNSMPFIGNHHFPFSGRVRNVSGLIWDMKFPDSIGT